MVAGAARGRRLVTPPGAAVRPTTDRVREAVFNALGSLDRVVGASVLDLFAGSGAMGVEALSRGARSAVFVDDSRPAVEAVKANLATCGLGGRARVVRAEAFAELRSGALKPVPGMPPAAAPAGPAAETASATFDLAVLDPPYDFDRWAELLAEVPATTVVIESDRPVAVPDGWELVRQRAYGGTVVTIAERTAATTDHPPEGEDQP